MARLTSQRRKKKEPEDGLVRCTFCNGTGRERSAVDCACCEGVGRTRPSRLNEWHGARALLEMSREEQLRVFGQHITPTSLQDVEEAIEEATGLRQRAGTWDGAVQRRAGAGEDLLK